MPAKKSKVTEVVVSAKGARHKGIVKLVTTTKRDKTGATIGRNGIRWHI